MDYQHHQHHRRKHHQEWTPSTGYVNNDHHRLPKCDVPPLPSERAEILAQAAKLQYDTKIAATHIQSDLEDIEKMGDMTLEDLYEQRRQMDNLEETIEEKVAKPLDDAERMHTKLESWIPLPNFPHNHNNNNHKPLWRRNHEFLHDIKEKARTVGVTTRKVVSPSPKQQQQQQQQPLSEESEEQQQEDEEVPSSSALPPFVAQARNHMRHSIIGMNDAIRERIVTQHLGGRHSPPRPPPPHHHDTNNNSGNQQDKNKQNNDKLTPEEQEQLDALQAGDNDIEDVLDNIGTQMDHIEIVAEEMEEETKRHGHKLERLHHKLDHTIERQRNVNHRTKKLVS